MSAMPARGTTIITTTTTHDHDHDHDHMRTHDARSRPRLMRRRRQRPRAVVGGDACRQPGRRSWRSACARARARSSCWSSPCRRACSLAGVAATFVMALGTGLTVASLAVLAVSARGVAVRLAGVDSPVRAHRARRRDPRGGGGAGPRARAARRLAGERIPADPQWFATDQGARPLLVSCMRSPSGHDRRISPVRRNRKRLRWMTIAKLAGHPGGWRPETVHRLGAAASGR